jgi:nucleoid-associated protein YgaU/DNA-binding SARP family transcriptional activator
MRPGPVSGGGRLLAVAKALVQIVVVLAVLGGLLGGVPYALLRWGDWPITGVPTWDQVRDLPSTIVTDQALLSVLIVALWAAWALFVVSFLAEMVAQARGLSRSSFGLGGPLQRMAGHLVSSLLVSIGSLGSLAGPARAATAAPPANEIVVDDVRTAAMLQPPTRIHIDSSSPDGELSIVSPEEAAPDVSSITVQRGDSPWSLAEEHLGDGMRWREIWELNRERTQPDGTSWANPKTAIQPGWRLILPDDMALPPVPMAPPAATVAGPTAGAPTASPVSEPAGSSAPSASAMPAAPPTEGPTAAHQVSVERGDNFWEIAEVELTRAWGRAPTDAEIAGYWQTLIDHNRDRLLPPGDPDLIYPGQAFTAPATTADPHAPAAPATPATPPADTGETGNPAPPASGEDDGTSVDQGEPGSDETGSETGSGAEDGTGAEEGAGTEDGSEQGSALPEEGSGEGSGDGDVVQDGAGEGTAGEGTADEGATEEPPASEQEEDPASGDEGATGQIPAAGLPGNNGESGSNAEEERSAPPTTENEKTPATDETSSNEDSDASALPVGLIAGGVALAGVVLLLEKRRRAQQRHRGRGRRVPLPDGHLQHEERLLREGAEVDRARLLDVALRAAAKGSGATGLPPLRWVEATDDAVLIVLDGAAPAPPGFEAVDPYRWVTTRSPRELAAIAGQAEMPVPTLIPVGTTADDAELLVELESSCVVTVAGPREETIGLLRAIAVAAATAPWSEQSRVLLVGMHGELTELPWVEETDRLAEAINAAEEHVDRAAAGLWAMRVQSTAQARAAGVTPEESEPLVVVSALKPDDRGDHQRLVSLAGRGQTATAIVAPASEGAMPVGRQFTIGTDGWLRIDGVDMAVWPHRLDDSDASIVVALLDQASGRHDVAPAEANPFGDSTVRRPVPAGVGAMGATGLASDPMGPGTGSSTATIPPPPSSPSWAAPGADDIPPPPPTAPPLSDGYPPPPPPPPPPALPANGLGSGSATDTAEPEPWAPEPWEPEPFVPEPLEGVGPLQIDEPAAESADDDVHDDISAQLDELEAQVAAESATTGDPEVVPAAPAPAAADAAIAPVGELPVDDVRHLSELLDDVEVLVKVLGEVEAVRLGGSAASGRSEDKLVPTRQKGLEAITYLSLREAAVDREDLELNLFPEGANAAKTVYNTVSAGRKLVGDDLFPPTEGGRYELSDRVVTDYGLFCDLVAQADDTEDVHKAAELLTEALGLVRGEPFTGVGRSYSWVGPHRGMIVAQVVDAAEELAEVRLATGDWRLAEWAARQGLRAFPSDERMYRLLMRAARAAGNVPGVQRVFRELCEVLADPDVGVEPEDTVHPETIALLEQLTGSVPRHGRVGA